MKRILLLISLLLLCSSCALLSNRHNTPKLCDGWIEGDVHYPVPPTVSQVWKMSLDVFQTPYNGYLARFPHYCDAVKKSPINCSYQAVIQRGKGKQFISSKLMGIRIYRHRDYAWKHAIFAVKIKGIVWLFDRNYGGSFPVMPMPEDGYLGMYAGKMSLESVRGIDDTWGWYEPFPLPRN